MRALWHKMLAAGSLLRQLAATEQFMFELSLIFTVVAVFMEILRSAPAVPYYRLMAAFLTVGFLHMCSLHWRGAKSSFVVLLRENTLYQRMNLGAPFLAIIFMGVGIAAEVRWSNGIWHGTISNLLFCICIGHVLGGITPTIYVAQATDEDGDEDELDELGDNVTITAKRLPYWIVRPPK